MIDPLSTTMRPTRPPSARPARRLPGTSIGIVPILWNNVDLPDLAPSVPAEAILDEAARLGFDGIQFGRGFPEGVACADALARRGLRLAEVYAELPCTADGPTGDAPTVGRARLAILHEAGGDVLVAACRVGGGRESWPGRGEDPAAPRLTHDGWRRLADTLDALASEAGALGHRLAFHPHTATFVETPAEIARLVELTDPRLVGICLDVGHAIVGGGDPVAMIASLGSRLTHVHLKDVEPTVLAQLRGGQIEDFAAAVRERIFTELGSGALDLPGVVSALEALDYAGWLMVEQDSSWLPPAEAAMVGRRALGAALAVPAR